VTPEPPATPPDGPARTGRPVLIVVAAAMAVLLLLGGVVVALLLLDDDEPAAAQPARLQAPLMFQQVSATQTAPCEAGALPAETGTTCYRLVPGGMTVQQVADVRLAYPDGKNGMTTWGVEIELLPADAARFAVLSEKAAAVQEGLPGRHVAIVVGGKVASAPEVRQRIAGPEILISGQFERVDAEGLVQRLTGRRPS
jgi:preprotein translocase subunit SecD